MQLVAISVSHHNTPVELRACLSLPVDFEDAFTHTPVRAGSYTPIREMVLLSTCNRLEVYALVAYEGVDETPEMIFEPVLAYLHEVFEFPLSQAMPFIQRYSGTQAVEHLFQVAAGLDSIAIGETQILGQVSRALDGALQPGTARHVLSSLFRAAIHTGKRVRTETEIGRKPVSLSMLAIELVEDQIGSLDGCTVLVIGAGKMGD